MGVLSHSRKFINIHIEKTGGSSLEVALSAFCNEEDVVPPRHEDLRRDLGFQLATRHYYNGWEFRLNDQLPWRMKVNILEFIRRHSRGLVFRDRNACYPYHPIFRSRKYLLSTHTSAKDVRDQFPDAWREYYKFTIVRNPIDQFVSFYRFRAGTLSLQEAPNKDQSLVPSGQLSIDEFAEFAVKPFFQRVWETGFEGMETGELDYIKYEALDQGLDQVTEKLDLEPSLSALMHQIHVKRSSFPKPGAISDHTKRLILDHTAFYKDLYPELY